MVACDLLMMQKVTGRNLFIALDGAEPQDHYYAWGSDIQKNSNMETCIGTCTAEVQGFRLPTQKTKTSNSCIETCTAACTAEAQGIDCQRIISRMRLIIKSRKVAVRNLFTALTGTEP